MKKTLDKSVLFWYYSKALCETELADIVGVYDIEGPPVPIPNTVVKLNRAENTWWVTAREDRSTPTQKAGLHSPADLLTSAFC